MASKPRAKEIALTILTSYERLYVENCALKSLLSTCSDPSIRDSWEKALADVYDEPEVQRACAELSSKFERLRAQILDAIDAEAVFGLLLGLPTKGKSIWASGLFFRRVTLTSPAIRMQSTCSVAPWTRTPIRKLSAGLRHTGSPRVPNTDTRAKDRSRDTSRRARVCFGT
jgi:hypothetical protein